jgi:hypothetical protein
MKKFCHSLVKVRDENGNFNAMPALAGESTYEIAVRHGYTGSEEEWLADINFNGWFDGYNLIAVRKMDWPLDSEGELSNGKSGQILMTNGDGTTTWTNTDAEGMGALPTTGGTVTGPVTFTAPVTQEGPVTFKSSVTHSNPISVGKYIDVVGEHSDGWAIRCTTGDIDVCNNSVINVKDPVDDQDAVTKKYVDNKTSKYLPLAGGTVSGHASFEYGASIIGPVTIASNDDWDVYGYLDVDGGINVNNNSVINVKDPVNDQDAATKNYVNEYGLGATAKADTGWNDMVETGWYSSAEGVPDDAEGTLTGETVVANQYSAIQKGYYYFADSGVMRIQEYIRIKDNGTWRGWIAVNPLMMPGVKYLTPEYNCGKMLYTMLVDCGVLPPDDGEGAPSKMISFGPATGYTYNVVRMSAYIENLSPLPYYGAEAYTQCYDQIGGYIYLKQSQPNTTAGKHVYAQIWFTETLVE